ncbi:MAG: 4-hydroxy-tetrahydrodipicolinate reductase [Mariprofundaceae bacterium]|nr:4-hydroxy-tetrahydrodipicolinate reductase [Mariprofundaceae bacterium]
MIKPSMMKTIITGATGRMGGMLVRALHADKAALLTTATERSGHPNMGKDAGVLAGVDAAVLVSDALNHHDVDVIIDFTAPSATLEHAVFAAKHGIPMVIGTTGFTPSAFQKLRDTLQETPVVMAANYSVGVNLALNLIEQAAQILRAENYDAEIFEAHHRHKVDAPSGTALAIGQSLAKGRNVALDDVAVYAREGITGARELGSIGFSVMRAGNIVGEHHAMFISDEERLEIRHIATDRMVFAKGAVRAAHWLIDQKKGWYNMQDVLGV